MTNALFFADMLWSGFSDNLHSNAQRWVSGFLSTTGTQGGDVCDCMLLLLADSAQKDQGNHIHTGTYAVMWHCYVCTYVYETKSNCI